MTRYGKQILDMINASTDHMTAEQIFIEMKKTSPKVVLATVYNNLNSLCEGGEIRRISVEGCPDRYDKTLRHDHLVCCKCGALTDVMLPDLMKELQPLVDAELISYDLKLSYICPECRKKAEKN